MVRKKCLHYLTECLLLLTIMTGYTKLFSRIVTSTIWSEPNDCRVLWITMLALKERDNVCRATVPGLAKLAGLSIEDTVKYLEKFMGPDKWSRDQDDEGRRLRKADDGWLFINGEKYQELMSAEDRREKNRGYQERHKAKARAAKPDSKVRYDPKGRTIEPRMPVYEREGEAL